MSNTDSVLIRNDAGKNAPLFSLGGYNYYYKENQVFKPISKKVLSPVTWYRVKFNSSNQMLNGKKLGVSGNSYYGYVASNFVNHLGFGNSKMIIKSNTDLKLDKVAVETINNNNFNVIGELFDYVANVKSPAHL